MTATPWSTLSQNNRALAVASESEQFPAVLVGEVSRRGDGVRGGPVFGDGPGEFPFQVGEHAVVGGS